ncbi:hypothetical protein MSAN_00775000 [Mycena sanguinolenta]|uniref:Uncharacterized protein n=1 Tax=Mycena sanguinolenta TaxID=230812 RepID=A0A8H6Z2F5_9AGAR|nr:hypothetical protein MSAN_00775000 [Mycena sanguinolenta]
MVLNVSLPPVSLATVALESCLYGVYLVLTITALWLTFGRNARTGRRGASMFSSPTFIGAILLCITITGHWILTVDRGFLAFIYLADTLGPVGFYGDLSQTTEVVKTGFLVTTLAIGDALIIYRLWIVWGHNTYVILFPAALLTGVAASGAGITYQFTQYKPGQNVFLSEAGRWITSDTVFTLCTNVYSTAFIAWRLWSQGRVIKGYGGPSLKSVLIIIVESAALYTVWTTFFLASYLSRSNLQFIVVDCWPAMTGISCMLIHARVGLGWARKDGIFPSSAPTGTGSNHLPSFAVNITRAVHTNVDPDYPMDSLNVDGTKGMV